MAADNQLLNLVSNTRQDTQKTVEALSAMRERYRRYISSSMYGELVALDALVTLLRDDPAANTQGYTDEQVQTAQAWLSSGDLSAINPIRIVSAYDAIGQILRFMDNDYTTVGPDGDLRTTFNWATPLDQILIAP